METTTPTAPHRPVPVIVVKGLGYLADFHRAARRAVLGAGRQHHYPVEIVAGVAAPHIEGGAAYWTTPNGTICDHPNAYNRKAFGDSRAVRWPSTRKIVVGAGWRPAVW